MNNIFKSDVILFTNKKENILYFLNKDYKGYSFHKDSEKTFSKIKEIKHIFFLKKKSLIYKSEYFFIEKEKDMILDYFKDVEIKEKIKFLMKKSFYQFLYLTKDKNSSEIYLNMIDKNTGNKVRYIIPYDGDFYEEEWREENMQEISFKIEDTYKQNKSIKKILNKNEYHFINRFSDIKTKYNTFPLRIQELMPIKLFESMYLEKPKNRILPGYGQIKEKTKKVIF